VLLAQTRSHHRPHGTGDLRHVVDTWAGQYRELGARESIRYVQIFENRGAMMGCSNAHPHCQIWCNSHLPNEVAKEQAAQLAWREARARCLICDYAALEAGAGNGWWDRKRKLDGGGAVLGGVAVRDDGDARRHIGAIDGLDDAERNGLADILNA